MKGEFKVKLGDRIMNAPAQSVMFIPRGTAHTFQNVGTEPGVLLVGVMPRGLEKMFEERQGVDAETLRALAKKHNMEVVGPPDLVTSISISPPLMRFCVIVAWRSACKTSSV